MSFKCLRCNYETNRKSNLKEHLRKINICEPLITDIPQDKCLELINEKKYEEIIVILKKIIINLKNDYYHNNEIKKLNEIILQKNELLDEKEETIKKQKQMIKTHNIQEKEIKEFIYIMQTPEFSKTEVNVYKLGRTLDIKRRMKKYPKGTDILFSIPCKDSIKCETELLEIFRNEFIQRTDAGSEYFEGDLDDMTTQIMKYFLQ